MMTLDELAKLELNFRAEPMADGKARLVLELPREAAHMVPALVLLAELQIPDKEFLSFARCLGRMIENAFAGKYSRSDGTPVDGSAS